MAHDIGHPPFGHIGEQELDELAKKNGCQDGFEGNAQSFRIVTRLSPYSRNYSGLNLFYRTLNGLLKYPWPCNTHDLNLHENKKFGTYIDDKPVFDWVRQDSPDKILSIEAEIMDYADEVAYAIHDIDDFHRVGIIPLTSLHHDNSEFNHFIGKWKDKFSAVVQKKMFSEGMLMNYRNLLYLITGEGDYTGSHDHSHLAWHTGYLLCFSLSGFIRIYFN